MKYLSAFLLVILLPSIALSQGYIDEINVMNSATVGKGSSAHSSAILDVVSITKGALFPRMTSTQRNAIASPATGLIVFDTTVGAYYVYNGSAWRMVASNGTNPNFGSLTVDGTIGVGAPGGASGAIELFGSTSGTVTVQPQSAAGFYNFNLPTTSGSSGQLLTSAGGGSSPMTWTTATDANTASAVVRRDGSGNFSAGTITANLTGSVTGNASTATALAANPSDCSAGQYATTIAASGNLTCAQVATSQLSGNINLGTQVTGTLGATNGGTGQTSYTTGDMLYASATNTLSKLGVGGEGQILKVTSGIPTWGTNSGAGAYASVLTSSSFETGANCDSNWTSAAGTDSCDSSVFIEGSKSLSISLSSVNGTVISQSVTPSVTLAGNNLEYSVWVYTTSTNINICALQGGSEIQCVAPTVTSQWQRLLMQIAAPSSGTVGLRLKTLSSTTATVKLDDAYVGPARFAYPVNAKLATTVTKLTSGSSATYTPPSGVTSLRIKMVGGGGGGAGGGTAAGSGSANGGDTCFGTNATACTSPILAAGGGGAANAAGIVMGGAGGSPTVNSPAVGVLTGVGGTGGNGPTANSGLSQPIGANGAGTLFGGGANGGANASGASASANTGAGGGGGGANPSGYAGGGGGAGAYIEAVISYPNIASSYKYTIGGGGSGGSAGTGGYSGGAGGSGIIFIEENYDLTVTAVNLANSADVLGMVFWHGSSTCPQGSMATDGSAVSRTTYAALFNRIGTTYGSGDGSTTFNLPDTRGIFIRGNGTSASIGGLTYSGTLGTKQNDTTKKNGLTATSTDSGHMHEFTDQSQGLTSTNNGGYGTVTSGFAVSRVTAGGNSGGYLQKIATGQASITTTIGAGDSETRPANIALQGCIYYVSNPVPMVTQSVIAKDNTTGVTVVNTINALTTNTTLDDNYETVYGNTSGGAFQITLPTAVGRQGKKYIIDKGDTSTNLLTIGTTSSQTIQVTGGTVTSIKLHRPGDPVTLQSDGSNWRIVAGGGERVERAHVTNGGSCAISSQSGAWISSVSRPGTGTCTMTLPSGIFSSAPHCVPTQVGNNSNAVIGQCILNAGPSTTSVSVACSNNGWSSADRDFQIVCTGPR